MKGLLLQNDLPPCDPNAVWKDGGVSYTLCTKRYSHWKYKSETELEFLSETKIATQDAWNPFLRRFDSKKTAIMVMDPWINGPDDFTNEYFGKITEEKILPLVRKAQACGHHIVVLSDDPSGKYNSKIPPELQEMVDDGRAKFIVHAADNWQTFSAYAKAEGIDKFIYTGFCSNLCILNRPLGLPKVLALQLGEVYFIPDCSAAMEHAETWENQLVHQSSSLLISQGMGLLIEYEDIMAAMEQ